MTITPVEGTNIAFSYRSKVEHKITDGKADTIHGADAAPSLATAAPGTFIDSRSATSPCRPAPPASTHR
jgi:long-chain fatty acid transport protein